MAPLYCFCVAKATFDFAFPEQIHAAGTLREETELRWSTWRIVDPYRIDRIPNGNAPVFEVGGSEISGQADEIGQFRTANCSSGEILGANEDIPSNPFALSFG
ncbi:hypothetical protein [Beijerinckia mobilis]|uniref:hypothetical protein n=1 Tax=Beijerinckia mobilis TaxID=231434 RepID=UPI0012EB4AEF|nr:hypothetical protein [Beijerinckia mobilis]